MCEQDIECRTVCIYIHVVVHTRILYTLVVVYVRHICMHVLASM